MPHARTDDRIRIYYEEHGRGFPLVLAYGIGGNTQMWDTNIEALSARYRLILWDPRGHGKSDSPEDPARYSFTRWALDLRDLLDHLRIRKAYVGGLSMGGGIATRFTLLYPRRVAALVVTNSSSAAGLPLSPDNLVMRAQSIKVTLEQGMDAMAEFAMQANPNIAGRLALDRSTHAADRRRSGSVAPAHEGDAREGQGLEVGGPLAGRPLREPRSAGGLEPNRPGLPRACRRETPLVSPRSSPSSAGSSGSRPGWCTTPTSAARTSTARRSGVIRRAPRPSSPC